MSFSHFLCIAFLICLCLLFSGIGVKHFLDVVFFAFLIFYFHYCGSVLFFNHLPGLIFIKLCTGIFPFSYKRSKIYLPSFTWEISLLRESCLDLFQLLWLHTVQLFKIFFLWLTHFISLVICQHLYLTDNIFNSDLSVTCLITQGLCHFCAPIFFHCFTFFAYHLVLFLISLLDLWSEYCVLLSDLPLPFYSCLISSNCL